MSPSGLPEEDIKNRDDQQYCGGGGTGSGVYPSGIRKALMNNRVAVRVSL